jgi:cyclopropane fatty-acyl-phospholipid synthase-like methyltransferase
MAIKQRISSVDWENDIYAKGRQLNRWPFSDVVSAMMRATNGQKRDEISILEIGCGAGNNVWFFAEEGFQSCGIDLSSSAIEFGKSYLSSRRVTADLRVGDISSLPWEDSNFDYVVDRGALTQIDYDHIEAVLNEVLRVLKPGGKMLCYTLIGMRDPDRAFGTAVSKNTYDRFTGGRLSKVGLTSFFTFQDLRHLFRNFSSVAIRRRVEYDEMDQIVVEEYSVTSVK